MNTSYKNKLRTFIAASFCLVAVATTYSCKESEAVAAKGGAILWAENCQRCHNLPDPTTFSDEQWETIGMHMQSRAMLTNKERDKIVGFMQQFNH